MNKRIRAALKLSHTDEKGQALILSLVLLLLGGLIIAPLLAYMSTGLQSGQVYEDKTDQLYAADSGVDDALWLIKYDHFHSRFASPGYAEYDFTTAWEYDLDEEINDKEVNVVIENVWVPKDIAVPTESEAQAIIEAGKLIVTGGISGSSTYKINVTYYPGDGENLLVETLGVWLPPGFSYVVGSSNLEADPGQDYYSEPETSLHNGSQAIIWSFSSVPFADFPDVDSDYSPMVTSITFDYSSTQAGNTPDAVSWITTSGVADIPYSWDADTKVYKILSTADETEIEAYAAKVELRKLGSAIAGDYRAIGDTLMIDQYSDYGGPRRDTLLDESDAEVSDIPDDGDVVAAYLYWSGWLAEELAPTFDMIFEDDCSTFDNWDNGNRWIIYNYTEFRGRGGSSASERYLTMSSSLDLSPYEGETIVVSWDQRETSSLESSDVLFFNFSADGGNTWSNNIVAFQDDIGSSPRNFSYIIPDEYLTAGFKMRFFLSFNSTNEYAYLDNIAICEVIYADDCSIFDNWNNGNRWTVYGNNEFRGHGAGSTSERRLTMASSLDLSPYQSNTVTVSWDQREYGNLESSDYFYFNFSGDGGSSWSGNIEAFHNDIGSSPQNFSYAIPEQYLTDDFRLRFYTHFNQSNEYVYIDNLRIYESTGQPLADTSAIFKIDGTQVYFDDEGEPAAGNEEITASDWSFLENQPGEYSYSCYLDVTDLVLEYSEEGDNGNHPGNGTYTVGDVYGDTGNEWSYAGWSLILIYSSAQTEGRQLYLYDNFVYADMNENVDFDEDGEPGGTISGFLAPEEPADIEDVEAAKLTCFVGEGDDYYNNDRIYLNGTKLWDGTETESWDDVWNSQSIGLSADGVDIDTFSILWTDDIIEPNDTSAQVDLPTGSDSWNLVYIIISFRSVTSTGGTITYLIR